MYPGNAYYAATWKNTMTEWEIKNKNVKLHI